MVIARKIRQIIISFVDWFYPPFSKYISLVTFRYAATGGMNTALDIFLYYIIYNFVLTNDIIDLGFISISSYIASYLIVFPVTFTNGFLLAKYVTFSQSELRGKVQLFRYGLSVLGSLILNYLLLKFFVEVVGIWATPSKILATCFVVVYSYFVQKHFSFKTAKTLIKE